MMTTNSYTRAGSRCLICNTNNTFDAILCRECSAPMALVRDTVAQHREPRIVSIVGESNVGKTVYLGFLLDMLSQQAGPFEAIPKGAYSIDVQQAVISHMAHRMFPPKTPMEADEWYWTYYQVRKRSPQSPWVDLVMPDMAGESLAAEVATPETFRVISNLVTKSSGTILLVDAGLAANGSTRPDFFSMKMMSYIDSIHGDGSDNRIDIPVAVLLAKSDYCPECFDDPQGFVKANLNRLWHMCRGRFSNVEFFACSVVGSLGYAVVKETRPAKVTAKPPSGKRTKKDKNAEGGSLSEWERRFLEDKGDGTQSAETTKETEAETATARPTSAEPVPPEEYVVPIPLHTALQGVLEPFEWIVDQL